MTRAALPLSLVGSDTATSTATTASPTHLAPSQGRTKARAPICHTNTILRSGLIAFATLLAVLVCALSGVSKAAAVGRHPVSVGLNGTYTATISGDAKRLDGNWRLQFRDGGYVADDNGIPIAFGRTRVTRHQLTFRDANRPCVGNPGRYRFRSTATSLTFTRIHDTCSKRAGLLAHTFARQPPQTSLPGDP